MERFNYVPGQEFAITPEGVGAALEMLRERVAAASELAFVGELTDRFPGARVVLVGGIVRDALIGLKSKDYDFVVEGVEYDDLVEFLAQYGEVEYKQSRSYGVLKFQPQGYHEKLDIALPRTEIYEPGQRAGNANVSLEKVAIEEDFSRRDYTINALGLDMKTGEIIDPFGGVEDLRRGQIRAVNDPRERFMEDPTRILRGIRFAAKLGFKIEEKTLRAMAELKDEMVRTFVDEEGREVARVPVEKVRDELLRALQADPVRCVELYDQLGILQMYLPEVAAMKGVPQPQEFHSEGDVFVHTKLVLDHLPQKAPVELILAALMHDIGKVDTYQPPKVTGDRIRFNGHAEVSARQAEAVLERLRVNKKDGTIAKTVWLVENHMKALSFAEMRVSTQKKLARHEQFPNLVALTAADAASSLRPDRTTDSSFVPVMQRIWQEVAREREAGKGPVLLDGHEIARVLKRHMPDFSQREHGRLIGKIKNMVMEAYDEGIVNSKDEALAWLSDNFEELVRKLK